MNYLAHTLLSKNHIDYQIANLLADPLKGKAWDGCSAQHLDGIAMHKAIDIFTDASPHVSRAKQRLGRGYLKAVVIDIVFDHFISKYWADFVAVDFDAFVQSFYHQAEQQLPQLPEAGQVFIQRLIRYDFFYLYGDFSKLTHIFKKFDERLSDKILVKESTSDYLPILTEYYQAIEADFLAFFPELITLFLQQSRAQPTQHDFLRKSLTGGENL